MFGVSLVYRIIVVTLLCSTCSTLNAAEPWEGEPFAGKPKDIQDRAKELPYPDDVQAEVLHRHLSFRLYKDGRRERRFHQVSRFKTRNAARQNAVIQTRWSPWREDRPEVKARVIQPDGTVFQLDPTTIAEAPARQFRRDLLSDDRVLHAPLPGVAGGCVFEREIITRESKPVFRSGVFERIPLWTFGNLRRLRVTIVADKSLPLHHRIEGVENVEPQVTSDESTVTVVYDVTKFPKLDSLEPFQPVDASKEAFIGCSTGKSWREVAAEYAGIVEEKIDPEAVADLAKNALQGTESREDAAHKLLAVLRETVRYTGIEFGASAIVPYSPKETLQRRFGDCKDQSTLLVSMLRASGFKANVALLRSAVGPLIREDLPGLGVFNHVIVHMPGDKPIWIDPTSPYTKPGRLPPTVEGRWALVADKDTERLIRLPLSDSQANRSREEVAIRIMPIDESEVDYRLISTGSFGVPLRARYAELTDGDRKDMWKEFAKHEYGSDEVVSVDISDASDLKSPFELTAKVVNSSLAAANQNVVVVNLAPSSLLDAIPAYLKIKESTKADAPSHARPRKHPLQLQRHVKEMEYRLIPPPGYELGELPKNQSTRIGPLSIASEFRREKQAAVVSFRLDTGDGRLTPKQVTELRDYLADHSAIDDVRVQIQWNHLAQKLIAEGRFREAFASYRNLIEDDPESYLHVAGYASSLLELGFRTEARKVAQQAVERDPESADARGLLGFVLMHDEIGRHTRLGYDRDGAIRELNRCLELDPKHTLAHWNLAVIHETDRFGNRFSPAAEYDEAISHYRKIQDDPSAPTAWPNNLAYCLFFANRLDELKDFLRSHEETPQQLLVAAETLQGGREKGVAAAERVASSAVVATQLQIGAAFDLEQARHYASALELFEANLNSNLIDSDALRSKVKSMRQLKRFEQFAAKPGTPEYPVQQLLHAVLLHGVDEQELREFCANESPDHVEIDQFAATMTPARTRLRTAGSPVERLSDILSSMTLQAEGDAAPYRVTVKDPSASLRFYVVAGDEKQPFRVLLRGRGHAELGRRALSYLKDEKKDEALRLLKWAAEEVPSGTFFHPFSGLAFGRIWSSVNKDDPENLKMAAAVLAASGEEVEEAISVLEKAIAAEESEIIKLQLQRALAQAYFAHKDYPKVETLARSMAERFPSYEEPQLRLANSLYIEDKRDECEAVVRGWLKRYRNASWARNILGELLCAQGDFQAGYELLAKPLNTGQSTWLDYNAAAWKTLFLDPPPKEGLDYAEKGVELSARQQWASLHTQACVLADHGKLREAHQTLVEGVNAKPLDRVASEDWVIIGRMAEHAGLPGAARDAYRRVEKDDRVEHSSTYALAQRRLKGLKKAEAP